MKRILLSIFTIGIVSAGVWGASRAFFTDTEKSVDNIFTAGIIDISVDGENPWSLISPYQLADMKPSQTEYINFVIKNVGSNPANVWKAINVTKEEDGVVSEPECLEGGGSWTGGSCEGSYNSQNNISSAINYDLIVWIYNVDPTQQGVQPVWWQHIYTDEMKKKLNTLNGVNVLLGMLPAGWWMKVQQSYHLDADTGNWAQGDVMTFDIALTAEQLKGTVYLENKNFANTQNPTIVHDDGIAGTLTYGVRDSKFNYSFTGKVSLANTDYTLIFYPELWSTPSGPGWPGPVIILGTATSGADKNISILPTSLELNQNILNMKVWLVKSADLTGNNFRVWNGDDYLFELGLMDYYDADL